MKNTPQNAAAIALSLLCSAVLAAPLPARAADELWEAAFRLASGDESVRRSARQALLEAGPAGFEVVLLATRTLGEATLPSLAMRLHCPMLAFDGGPTWSWPDGPLAVGHAAAGLLAELLQSEPELSAQLVRSAVPAERKIGLLGLSGEADRLLEALDAIREEADVSVVEYARRVIPCATLRARGDEQLIMALTQASLAARARRAEMLPPVRCEEAGFSMGPVLDELLQGTARASGWQRSGQELTVLVSMSDGARVMLSPRCALELYDTAARQLRHLPGLVMPFVEGLTLDPGDRREALRRAERDLLLYPAEERNRLAARLVIAGGRSEHQVTFDAEEPFAQEELLEAAARQGQPAAWRVIEQAAFCRGDFSDSERIALLGFVGTREAAETAAELARRCPRARAAATAALVRMGDRRAADFLAGALESPGFSQDALERALVEHLSPRLAAALQKIAAGQGAGATQAANLLERLQVAGKLR